MDAVELGRRRAAELHAAAVERGLDPAAPYLFAVEEANRRGLDVEAATPGSTQLDGGQATLVFVDDLIIHENGGSPFEQAFLVAHEIGHHELGDANTTPTALHADMARGAEPSPTGVDRVVDYGRRQRREVQMDLFARELLLPRPFVRRLHLEEGLSASQIAERMGAPYDVVAQQLFDALLLPAIENQDDLREERPLNATQEVAAAHRGCAYLLEAGPGTGKTRTLTARVLQLLEEDVDPRGILVLTYSNKAAAELAERIADIEPEHAAAIWVGTFHAFGLDLIRRLGPELSLPSDPRLMDRVEAVELLEAEFPRLELEHYRDLYDPTRLIGDILAAISRAKDEVVYPDKYAERAEEMRLASEVGTPRNVRALEAAEVARVYELYEDLKHQRNALDFGDLVALPVQLLESRSEIAVRLQQTYDHILVDEYQDVNRASVRLLQALCPSGRNLWVVGDARQSIYRFRGASPVSTSLFTSQDFPGARSSRLEINYRSTTEIVAANSTFAINMTASATDATLCSHRGSSGHPLELRLLGDKGHESVAIADAIGEMLDARIAYRDQAVLCTGNERLGHLARDLEGLGIPVLYLGSLFERAEVKDLLALLSLLSDRRAMGLVRVGAMVDFKMSLADVSAVLEHLRDSKGGARDWLVERDGLPISPDGRLALDRLAEALDGFDAAGSPWSMLCTVLLDRTRLAARIAQADSIAVRSQGIALWQLLNFLRVQPRGQGLAVPRLLRRIRRLVAIGDDRDLRQLPSAAQSLDAVRLMTIHGAKGLEFKCVHLPGLNQDTLPSASKAPRCLPPEGVIGGCTGDVKVWLRAGDAEERDCLFYVASSRPRDRFLLYAVTQKRNGTRRPLSPFLERLGPDIVRRTVMPSRALPVAQEDVPIALSVRGRILMRDSQIAMLQSDKCKRRFFYTHVLRIGGRRNETDFMRMHEAVRSVVQAVVHEGLDVADTVGLHTAIQQACDARGLKIGGSFDALRSSAVEMVTTFLRRRAAHRPEQPSELILQVGSDQISFMPDDVLIGPHGGRIYRRVRTGMFRKADTTDLGVAAALLAVADNTSGAAAEVVHLSSDKVTPLTLSSPVLSRRRTALQAAMDGIRAGDFPASPNQRVCPRCPAFFVCGRLPTGPLKKDLSGPFR